MISIRERLLRDGYLIIGAVFVLLRLFQVQPWDQSVDAYAYWTTRDGVAYGNVGAMGAYLYSPAFAMLLAPVTWVGWPVFAAAWTALNFVILRLIVGRLALVVLLFPPVAFEVVSGNVHLLIALAIVAGARYPALWAIPILTKITPGIGLLWHVIRRERRPAIVALSVTGVLVVVSALLLPEAWRAWLAVLTGSLGGPVDTVGWYLPLPFLPRLAAAVAIISWGAMTGRHWTVPVAVTLAMPVIWLNALAVLVALVPMLWPDHVTGALPHPSWRLRPSGGAVPATAAEPGAT